MVIIPLFFYCFGLTITLGAVIWAAASDLKSFRIPNLCSLLVLVGFALAYIGVTMIPVPDHYPPPILHGLVPHLIAAAIVFITTLVLFLAKAFGAGDAKLASALALWFGLEALPAFIFYTSLIGGLMGVTTLLLRRYKPLTRAKEGSWLSAAQAGQNRLPYGVAIALGFVLAACLAGHFDITEIINAVENTQ